MIEEMRINIPQENVEKFKQILLYILKKVGGKPNIGETVLYKLLYFIDFDYYEKYETQLMGLSYIRNHHGPTPKLFQKIINEMIRDNQIEKIPILWSNEKGHVFTCRSHPFVWCVSSISRFKYRRIS